ncbi:MAG: GntR family transcriptional regulator [Spirochaetales bacterium]|nr:GntR family transcriptional regulator [Spirochaetales bacterium]
MAETTLKKIEFSLDPKSGVPFYKQIILQVEMAIADGRILTGEQLPTVRSLAVDLSINPNTVARAYNELEIRGIVNTQQGTGTFISGKKTKLDEIERERVLAGITQSFIIKAGSYGFSIAELIEYLKGIEAHMEEKK